MDEIKIFVVYGNEEQIFATAFDAIAEHTFETQGEADNFLCELELGGYTYQIYESREEAEQAVLEITDKD